MPDIRVNRLRYGKISADWIVKLGIIAVALSWIGKPFYVILTVGFIFLFAAIEKIGYTSILLVEKLIHLAGFIFSLRTFQQKSRKSNFSRFKAKILLNLQTVLSRPPTLNLRKKRYAVIFLLLVPFVFMTVFWFAILRDLPKPGELITRNQVVSTKIYDRNGVLLYKIFRNQNRTLVRLDDLPLYSRQATIAIEDSDFYSHPGVSIRGITRAIFRNFTHGELTGGSTITQQLVKNTLLSPEKTFTRKIKEIILAIQVELVYSKDQIFEMYLNEVGYGGAAYGIEEASQLYFGKHAKDLTLAESALIAGLPKAPTTYSPFGANPQLSRTRQLEVLAKMVQKGDVSQEDATRAAGEQIVFAAQQYDIKAPHFVMYIKELLAKKYGERMVEEGGLEVTTSLDLSIQELAEKSVGGEINKLKGLHITNGSALVANPSTGEILAMVGSKNYFDLTNYGNYNVTTALRQPGSSIKPINYSYALESGKYSAASLISDSPITYSISGSEPYSPRNYDNRYRGSVTLRTALASSLNIPAVKVLASYGTTQMIEQGTKLGITTWTNPSRFGLSLTLGGGEVKMVDMAVAYGTFANYGKRVDLQPILKVVDYRGRVLEEKDCLSPAPNWSINISHLLGIRTAHLLGIRTAHAAEAFYKDCGEEVLDPRVAFIITDILRDNKARSLVFGSNSLLVIPNHPEVSVKTGTTQNLRDNWTIGYTRDYVVTAWVGNDDNTPMSYVASGVTGATPIWHTIMKELLKGQPSYAWPEPEDLIKIDICPATGTLPCEGCGGKTEYFIPGTEPKFHCVPKNEESPPVPPGTPEKQANGQIL